jgi:type VI secretion system protein ImpG
MTPELLDPPMGAPDAVAALRFELQCLPDVSFQNLDLSTLRFYLNGESKLIHALYELLSNNCARIVIRKPSESTRPDTVALSKDALRPVGFAEDEDALPYPRRSFVGYRLLQEYFSFPEKFFFFDLTGLERLAPSGFEERAEIIILISPFERQQRQQMLEVGVSKSTVKLNCSPIINLFPQTAEPLLLDGTKYEHPVIPDVRRRRMMEVYSIDEVVSTRPDSPDVIRYEPFFSYRHGAFRDSGKAFWHARRRPSGKLNDQGTEVSISLVDLTGQPTDPDADTATVRCTCTNRDLPSRLPFGREEGDFELEGNPAVNRIVALGKPTGTVRPPLGKAAFWRLISHLSLNYLSLVDDGREALQEILKLYDFTGSPHLAKQVGGIVSLSSKEHFAPVRSETGIVFARGRRVEMGLDEEQFVGGGAYLFASVLERFLGLYASMNSFSQLVVRTNQRKEVLSEWPPRAGDQILL